MYGLIDGTRFYSESTSIYKPEQRLRPNLVTAGQGIIIAANRISSNLGICKFTPVWDSVDLLKLHGGRVYRANFNTFSHISDRFMTCVEKNTSGSSTFRYSVDELFISLHHLDRINVCLDGFITSLRQQVYRETGVPLGAGVGPTLTLAKVASWAGKNIRDYKGQCCLKDEKHTDSILHQMPVGKVWNIGSSYERQLKHDGVTTALQLKNCNPKVYQKRYSINLANVILELNGVAILNYSNVRSKKKQIWSTASYRDRLRDADSLFSELAHHCAQVMFKVREQKSETKTLSVFVGTGRYDKCSPFYRRVEIKLEAGLTDTTYALKKIRQILDGLIPQNFEKQPIYKIGVGSIEMVDSEIKQFDLFEPSIDNRYELNTTIDSLNTRFGKGTIYFGSQKRQYRERNGDIEFSHLENYYTDTTDLLKVKCI